MATFRKHGKGWQVRVSWYDDDGKRHYTSKAGFKTKTDAKAYALELEQRKMTHTLSKKQLLLVSIFGSGLKHINKIKYQMLLQIFIASYAMF